MNVFSKLFFYFFMLSIFNSSAFTELKENLNVPTYWLSVVDDTVDVNNNENRFLCDGMTMSIQPFENLKHQDNTMDLDYYCPGVVIFSDSQNDDQEYLCKYYSSFFKVNFKTQSLSYSNLLSTLFESYIFKGYMVVLYGSYMLVAIAFICG